MKLWLRIVQGSTARCRQWLSGHWRRALVLRQKLLLSEENVHLLLAAGIGIAGGTVNLLFFWTYDGLEVLLYHQHGHLAEISSRLDWWQRLLSPALGGLAAGLALWAGTRLIGPRRTGNFLEAVVAGDGRLSLRAALVQALSSLLSISSGASIGREGLITQLSSAGASKWGQLFGWQPYRLRLMVACGAAAGMAAAYNAPLAGAVFAAEIVLGNFSMNLFGPLILSAVVACMVSRSVFGIEPWYQVPSFNFTHLSQLPWFIVLGIVSGIAGAFFLKSFRWSEALFRRLPIPLYARVGLAGLAVGLLAVGYPEVWGNGYEAASHFLIQPVSVYFLLGLFLAKVAATVLAVGAGTVGGVFTPTLFVGAAVGCGFGAVLHSVGFAETLPAGAFALVGMGSVLAATVHSPLLAMIMVFELSLNYSIMPPLMLACAVSTLISRRLHPDSVYTATLRFKGLETEETDQRSGATTENKVGDLMHDPIEPVLLSTSFRNVANRFLASTTNHLPVVDARNRLAGIIVLQDLKEYLNAGEGLDAVIAYDLMRPAPECLTPDQSLTEALPVLLASDLRNIPVVNNREQNRLIGALVRAEALGLLSEAITSQTLKRL
jgi:chloride channel protein, CIC family